MVGKHSSGRQGGFTLIELLVVILVLGILSAIVITAVSGSQNSALVTACRSDWQSVNNALTSYRNDYSNFEQLSSSTAITKLQEGGYLASGDYQGPDNAYAVTVNITSGSASVQVSIRGGTAQAATGATYEGICGQIAD